MSHPTHNRSYQGRFLQGT